MKRIAVISVHGCPLAHVGERDTGGMSIYVSQLARKLGLLGIEVDVYTRVHDPADAQIERLGHNARVVHIPAGGLPEQGAANHLTGDALSEYENAAQNSYSVEVEKAG